MASIIGEKVLKSTGKSYAGVIRPGTKVPTKSTLANPTAKAIFERVGRGEIDFREAEKLIGKETDIRYPFYPKNPEHFNLSGSDFSAGNVAVLRLLDLYGELHTGDDRKKLYSFPIVFQDGGTADSAIPSRFEVNSGPMKYRSIDDQSDGSRKCVYLKPVDPEAVIKQRAARVKQVAPREFTVRGDCEPTTCPEFSCGICKFRGTVEFYIPELQGLGLIRMSTSSTYAVIEIWKEVDRLYKMYGRLPNFTPDGKPVFSLTKKKRQAKFFDEDGKEATGDQWVPVLNANLDVARMMWLKERNMLRLTGTESAQPPSLVGAPSAWTVPEKTEIADATPVANPSQEREAMKGDANTGTDLGFELAHQHGIGHEVYAAWAKAKFGLDWESEEASKEALDGFKLLAKKIKPDCLGPVLKVTTLLFQNAIPVGEVGMPFLVKEFGNSLLQDKALLDKARQRVVEMMESGGEVALAFMKQSVAKVA